MNTYHEDLPIILGLTGGYATGKTVTANGIAPSVRMQRNDEEGPPILWDHLYFALPLYRMATARQSIEGAHAQDRIRYEIHSTLTEVFGENPLYGAPPYRDLVDMVEQIATYPCAQEGKPRSFLQYVGTNICRAYDPDCWVKWMDRKIKRDFLYFQTEAEREEERDLDYVRPHYGVVLSDCRFPNEAEFVKNHPNGILLKLTARPEVIDSRQINRDGQPVTATQKLHESEQAIESIPLEWFTEVVDTSDMSIQEQINKVKSIVHQYIGVVHA